MSNPKSYKRPPRVIFLGMQSSFSTPSLHALLDSGIQVCAVVTPLSNGLGLYPPAIRRREPSPKKHPFLPMYDLTGQHALLETAWERQIPVWEVYHLSDPETLSTLSNYQADVICVACYSRRVPKVVLDVPALGCLNVHPSLLPANRGPVPLFWTFREGARQTGVTIHLMDEHMDTGDILAQASIEVPDGISYAQLEARCALLGAELLAQAVWERYEGRDVRIPQEHARSSYHSFPTTRDFVIAADEWSAQHVYNFICGTLSYGNPLTLLAGGKEITVVGVISYSHGNTHVTSGAVHNGGDEWWVRCRVGEVRIRGTLQEHKI